MKLSVIIVSWNVCEDLVRCLESVYRHAPSGPYEILLVDNASRDETVPVVEKNFAGVKLIRNAQNLGFARANNQAVQAAAGEYILLLNPDTQVLPGALDAMIRQLDEHPSVGACGPKILNADGTVQVTVADGAPTFRAQLYGKTILRKTGLFRGFARSLKQNALDPDRRTFTRQLSGAAVMIRAEVFRQVGLLDEGFFMYYEDTDLFYRIAAAGFQLLYLPTAEIIHYGERSSRQVSAQKRLLILRSLFYFFRKHYGKTKTALYALVFKPAYLLRILWDLVEGLIGLLIFGLFDAGRGRKAGKKFGEAVSFLSRCLIPFLRI